PVLIATARDITQTKAASAALASSEKRNRDTADFLETLLNSIPDVIGVQNDNHNIIRYNSAGYKFLGLSEAEVKGKKCYELIGGKIPCDNCATTEVYKTLKPARIEKYVPEMDIYFDVRSYPILDDSGRLKMVIEHLRDISDIKKAEKIQQIQYNIAGALVTATGISELMETVRLELSSVVNADNFFMALYNQTDDTLSAVHFVDQHDEFNSWKAEGTLSGRVVKENRPLLVKGSDISLDDEVSDEVIGTPSQCWLGVPLKVEERAIGVMVVQSYTNSAAYSEKTIELMELVANQVSLFIEGKRSVENAIKLLVGVEQSPVSMCITDKSGVVEFVNKAFCDTTGYSQEEIMGENPRILKSGYHPDTFYKEMWDTILKGLPWTGRFRNRKKNGEEYWANAVISPLIDKYGEITRFIAVQEDITKDIRMVEELRLAKEKAEENDRLKSAFLANMSHEIRTPMNGILGFIEIMQQPDLSEDEQKQYYDLIRQASVRLLNTINDIIEISKIESGQQSVNISAFNLGEVINFCNDFFRPEAYGKGLDFTLVNKLKDPDRLINSDRIKIESILTNLLKNAMKFTSAGFIKLSAYEEDNQIVLSVEDSGIGIPPGSIETIFDRFVQADQSYSKYYEGSGLGLAISDAYARMLGGSLTVNSVQGKGSTFFLRIPELNGEIINNTGMDVKGKGSTTGLTEKNRGTHILVAEDDEASFMFLNHILRAEGYTVTRASTGEEVVDIVEKSPGIDLILMDIKMPGLDGWETTRIIKDKNPSMPIIAQTAYALISDQEKAMERGFDGYISKPVKKELLFDMIRTHLGDLVTE
ncbi:MAG: PAS domain S-box protein, partial [Bacteroidales bacterium]